MGGAASKSTEERATSEQNVDVPILMLPSMVHVGIVSALDIKSCVVLSSVCKDLRKPEIYQERLNDAVKDYGLSPAAGEYLASIVADNTDSASPSPTNQGKLIQTYLKAHLQLLRLQRFGYSSASWDIAWGGSPQYWVRAAPDLTSPYGSVAVLRHVCWLELQDQVYVGAGSHHIFLRCSRREGYIGELRRSLRVMQAEGNNTDAVSGSVDVVCSEATLNPLEFLPHRWFWCYIGRVHSRSSFAIVRWNLQDHSDMWKGNLTFDRVITLKDEQLGMIAVELTPEKLQHQSPFYEETEECAGRFAARGALSDL